jgi:K+-sensing histidine kinase KdpD
MWQNPKVRAPSIVMASVLSATLLTFPIANVAVHSRSLLFVAAVIVASRYAGAVAGLCTALLSVVVFDWFFGGKPHLLEFNLSALFRAAFFCAVSLLITSLENQRRRVIRSLEKTNTQLRNAMREVKVLHGLLPVCMYCKQIRTEAGAWTEMEQYIREHSEAEFSHGVCPDCLRQHYPDIYERIYPPTQDD